VGRRRGSFNPETLPNYATVQPPPDVMRMLHNVHGWTGANKGQIINAVLSKYIESEADLLVALAEKDSDKG
jgi:hypothetical protein